MNKKEIAKKAVDMGFRIGDQLAKNKELFNQGVEIWKMNAQNKKEIKQIEEDTKKTITEITERYQTYRYALSCIFTQRQQGLNAHYAALDQALKNNDREIIITSLKGISSIIESNPLENFSQFSSIIENKDETLYLDF
jgi:ERCC4-type nuclease